MSTAPGQFATQFAWMSKPTEMSSKRAVLFAIGISILLHLLAFLIFAILIIGSLFAPKDKSAMEPAKPRNIELTVVPPDEDVHPFTLAPPPPERLFVDSRGLDIAKEAAEHPLFESDENMKAASELLANGDSLLPGQLGKERPFNAFQSQRSLLGPTPEPFSPTPPSAQPLPPPSPPTVQVAQQEPDPAPPNAAPQDPTPPPPEADKTAEKTPKPAKEATKPNELKTVEKVLEDQIALAKREAKLAAVTQIQPPTNTPSPVAHAAVLRPLDQQMVRLTTPAPPAPKPQPRHESGYQPEQEKNHIESSISNRGKGAVDSIATPMAKYRKQVNDAIGSRWYCYIHDKMDLIAFGSVRISFVIDAQGRLEVEGGLEHLEPEPRGCFLAGRAATPRSRRPRKRRCFAHQSGASRLDADLHLLSVFPMSLNPTLASLQSAYQFFHQGGFFMLLLLLCSMVSFTVIVLRALALRRDMVMPSIIEHEVEAIQPGDEDAADRLAKLVRYDYSALGRIIDTGLHHLNWPKSENLEAVQTRARREIVRLESGIFILEIVVGIAPLLGLLGAVSGLVSVFAAFGNDVAAQDPHGIAKGISEALSTTIVGLSIAIPSLIAPGLFQEGRDHGRGDGNPRR